MVSPILLYGSEIFAWSPAMERACVIERQFIRSMIGLHNGFPGPALEVMLGRQNLAVKAKIRALVYWRKLISRDSESVVYAALNYQKSLLDSNLHCWLTDIKMELNKLGLGSLWASPETLSINRFKRTVKKRFGDISLQNNLNKLAILLSAKFFIDSEPGMNYAKRLRDLPSNQRRRLHFKTCFNSFEELISRENGSKSCLHCLDCIDDDIAAHLILFCPCIPKKYEKEPWFIHAKSTLFGQSSNFRKFFFDFLASPDCNHHVLKNLQAKRN